MSINMANVKKIQMPFPATIYKKTFSFTNSSVVYRGTSTPCPIEVTLYSTTTPSWTGGSDTSTLDFWKYVRYTLGYEATATTEGRIYLIVDNPYDFEYIYNNQSCVLASCQLRNSAQGGSYFLPWFSVPGAGSVSVGSAYTITEKTGWVLVGTFNEYDFYNNAYLNGTSGNYIFFSVSKDILTEEEYITNYCINGVSYPNVTITSVSGGTYYLSDGHSYTPKIEETFKSFGGLKEVKKIEDGNGNKLWPNTQTGTYTSTLTRSSNNRLTNKSNATLISEISTATGIPEANITIIKRTYNLIYYKASNASNNYIAIKQYSTGSGATLYTEYSTTTGSHSITFETTLDSVGYLAGYQGNSESAITNNFSTSYNYFRAGYTQEVVVEYEY